VKETEERKKEGREGGGRKEGREREREGGQ
jgi:hypothetical protein